MADDKEQPGESSCSSSSSRRARHVNRSSFSDGEWDCSVCTFRNTADAFKCFMCDVRKGTSTRKPRINTDNVVAQVVRQQEQIRQQAIKLAKPTLDDDLDSSSSSSSSSSSNTTISSSSSSSSSTSISSSTTSISDHPTTPPPPLPPASRLVASSLGSKVFTYQPPVSHGKAGILIDRKKTTTSAITVNNITVTITEYATRKRSIARRALDAKSTTKKKDRSTGRQSNRSERDKDKAKGSSQSKDKGTVSNEEKKCEKGGDVGPSSTSTTPKVDADVVQKTDTNNNGDRTAVSENSRNNSSVKEESTDTTSNENIQLPPLDPKKALYATMKR